MEQARIRTHDAELVGSQHLQYVSFSFVHAGYAYMRVRLTNASVRVCRRLCVGGDVCDRLLLVQLCPLGRGVAAVPPSVNECEQCPERMP